MKLQKTTTLIKTRRNSIESLQLAAMKADGNRRCDKCPLHPCSMTQFKVCTNVFREGFRKGAAWKQKQLKNNENP